MAFLISDAMASSSSTSTQGNLTSLILTLIVFGLVFYLAIIYPQQKRTKEHKKMMESISKGDEVLTNGGLIGRVIKVTKVAESGYVTISLNDSVEVIIKRDFITSILPKGTMKFL